MANDIYSKFDAAFRNVSAYALVFDGKAVGRVVVKHGNAATAYVQVWGAPMATARATGYGYDKVSAAVMGAILKLADNPTPDNRDKVAHAAWQRIVAVGAQWGHGTRYTSALEAAGFTFAIVI